MTGYKWTARKSDKKLFIVTLLCNNEFVDEGEGRDKMFAHYASDKSFYTTDCIVQKIEDENGNTVESVDGHAFKDFVYFVGQEIKGIRIFYMHDKEYLMTYMGDKWESAINRLTEILTKWNRAYELVLRDPLFLLSPTETIATSLQERYFFDIGGTIEDLHILDMEGDILKY